jgi:hypothetical protein
LCRFCTTYGILSFTPTISCIMITVLLIFVFPMKGTTRCLSLYGARKNEVYLHFMFPGFLIAVNFLHVLWGVARYTLYLV